MRMKGKAHGDEEPTAAGDASRRFDGVVGRLHRVQVAVVGPPCRFRVCRSRQSEGQGEGDGDGEGESEGEGEGKGKGKGKGEGKGKGRGKGKGEGKGELVSECRENIHLSALGCPRCCVVFPLRTSTPLHSIASLRARPRCVASAVAVSVA